MEAPIHSSFIPTPDAVPTARDIDYGKSAADIFVLLGLIALVIAGAVSAGVFLYQQFASTSLTTQKEQLALGQKSFSADAIDQLMRLDDRLRLAEGILASHTAPSVLFSILEETTLQSIQFTGLDYMQPTANDIKVVMKGRARTVNAIALQANMFSRHAAIKDPIFQINEFTKDGVTFTVSMMLNADAIRLERLISASDQPRQQQSAAAVNAFSQPDASAPDQPRDTPQAQEPVDQGGDGFGSFTE